jgi:uncharacterized protein (DUF305 family)
MRAVAGLALLGLLAACDGGGDPVQQAVRETAEANQSAAVRATAEVEAASASRDAAWVADMIARREDEIARAQAILRDSRDPEIRRLAQAATDARARELSELRAWRPGASLTRP